jgi:plastocyanin/FtsP/CotA-like multicopper oxidase with cupredoxin domain
MATIEYWIQLENRPWDFCPHNVDRMSGQNLKQITQKDPEMVTLKSPGTGATHTRTMFAPTRDDKGAVSDALILRRYKPPQKADQSDAWSVPDDRKINPWDLNEPDPTDTGTMGTIPGPVIECNVGDSVVVHFRNNDTRTELGTQQICFPFPFIGEICFPIKVPVPIDIEKRCHSLHPHGFVFEPTSDGAYPLSPPDATQPVGGSPGPDETAAWASVPKFSGQFKKGDRVPPGGTFIYRWNTFGWPTTAGVWLYHDHSICDMDNVESGAIGIIVIHNPNDAQQEVDIRDPADPNKLDPNFLPGGSPNGSPKFFRCFPIADKIPILRQFLEEMVATEIPHGPGPHMGGMAEDPKPKSARAAKAVTEDEKAGAETPRMIQHGEVSFQLDKDLTAIHSICFPRFRTPPSKALYLQLFHSLKNAPGMAMNGRVFLGNTPTMVAGVETRMRFGVVGMGSVFHTFHIHGHRWILPGPDGNTPGAIQGSAQIHPVSQFEDTRTFGPANSFVFTIDEKSGSFMRAGGPGPSQALGEWHMHCHVLQHMMQGMMGSLLIINGGEIAFALPQGVPCPEEAGMGGMDGMDGGGGAKTATVHVVDFQFNPDPVNIKAGDTVQWVWDADDHSTTSDTAVWDSGVHNKPFTFSHTFPAAGTFPYHCVIHGGAGTGMHGTVIVT